MLIDSIFEFLGMLYTMMWLFVITGAFMDFILEKYLLYLRLKYIRLKYKDDYQFWYGRDTKPREGAAVGSRKVTFDDTERFLLHDDVPPTTIDADSTYLGLFIKNIYQELKMLFVSVLVGGLSPVIFGGILLEAIFNRGAYLRSKTLLEDWLYDKDVRISKIRIKITVLKEEHRKAELAKEAYAIAYMKAGSRGSTKLNQKYSFDEAKTLGVL